MLSKIEQYLFYIFVFSIPFQTRKILWYSGWRFEEWSSVSVYLTDVLFFVLLLFWVVNFLKQGRKFSIFNFQFSIKLQFLSSKLKNPNLYLFLFIIIFPVTLFQNSG